MTIVGYLLTHSSGRGRATSSSSGSNGTVVGGSPLCPARPSQVSLNRPVAWHACSARVEAGCFAVTIDERTATGRGLRIYPSPPCSSASPLSPLTQWGGWRLFGCASRYAWASSRKLSAWHRSPSSHLKSPSASSQRTAGHSITARCQARRVAWAHAHAAAFVALFDSRIPRWPVGAPSTFPGGGGEQRVRVSRDVGRRSGVRFADHSTLDACHDGLSASLPRARWHRAASGITGAEPDLDMDHVRAPWCPCPGRLSISTAPSTSQRGST